MARERAITGPVVELSKLTVAYDTREKLKRLARETGATQTWIRRKALDVYLDARLSEFPE